MEEDITQLPYRELYQQAHDLTTEQIAARNAGDITRAQELGEKATALYQAAHDKNPFLRQADTTHDT